MVTKGRENLFGDVVDGEVGANHASPLQEHPYGLLPGSLGAIVGSFKSAVSRQAGSMLGIKGIWQRNYYDHIIRNQIDLDKISAYIQANPQRWDDEETTAKIAHPYNRPNGDTP